MLCDYYSYAMLLLYAHARAPRQLEPEPIMEEEHVHIYSYRYSYVSSYMKYRFSPEVESRVSDSSHKSSQIQKDIERDGLT